MTVVAFELAFELDATPGELANALTIAQALDDEIRQTWIANRRAKAVHAIASELWTSIELRALFRVRHAIRSTHPTEAISLASFGDPGPRPVGQDAVSGSATDLPGEPEPGEGARGIA